MFSIYHQQPIPFVNHVHIYVQNLQRSFAFYQSILGFKVLNQSSQKIDLTTDGKTAMLTIEEPQGVKPKGPRTTGLYHLAILLPSRKDLAIFFNHLLVNHVPLQGGSDHGFSEALYFADPDGNGIEVYSDKTEKEWLYEEDGSIKGISVPIDFEGLMTLVKEEIFTELPEDTLMGHIHLHVNNLEETDRFYTEGLGLDFTMKYGQQASFYSFGNYHHHIAANTWNGKNAPRPLPLSVGLTSYTIRFYTIEELQAVVNRLEGLGYEVNAKENHFVTQDPSGNQIILAVE